MSQTIKNLLEYFYRAFSFIIDLFKKLFGGADAEDPTDK